MKRPVRIWFDVISPNAYLAWTQIHRLAARHGREVEALPVLFAALLDRHGRLGPAEQPAQARWMAENCLRKAARLGVPLAAPHSHPFNPLLALRVASRERDAAEQRRVVDALFAAVWVDAVPVAEPEALARHLDAAGFDGAGEVATAGSAESKARLRAATEAALDAGVFGVPTMEVDGRLFWGFDDFVHVELALEGRDPLDEEAMRPWAALRASARRRRAP